MFASQSKQCPGGGIGRRVGLNHQWPQGRAGSTPALGTKAVWFLIFRSGESVRRNESFSLLNPNLFTPRKGTCFEYF